MKHLDGEEIQCPENRHCSCWYQSNLHCCYCGAGPAEHYEEVNDVVEYDD